MTGNAIDCFAMIQLRSLCRFGWRPDGPPMSLAGTAISQMCTRGAALLAPACFVDVGELLDRTAPTLMLPVRTFLESGHGIACSNPSCAPFAKLRPHLRDPPLGPVLPERPRPFHLDGTLLHKAPEMGNMCLII